MATANGTKVTDEQAAAIRKAATEAASYKDQLADLDQRQRQAAETARFFGNAVSDSFADAILEGRSFSNVLADLQKQITRAAIQAAFTGQGPLASLLGTAPSASAGSDAVGGIAGLLNGTFSFNPIPTFRANGGPVDGGRPYTVGERGRELFVLDQSGRVYPITSPPAGGGGMPNVTVINNTGTPAAAQVQQRPDGSLDVILDQMETRSAGRVASERGALAAAVPGARRLRG